MSGYRSVILDVDSTLSGIEGVDWLAARRPPEVARHVAGLTDRAMAGEIALDQVYAERLTMIRPSAAEVAALAEAYGARVAPDAAAALRRMREAGIVLAIVSGGIRQALVPFAGTLGFADGDVHAVRLVFDEQGEYAGYDTASPLVTQHGKHDVATTLALPEPVLAVGDGATDLAMAAAVDAFVAFTGFVRRAPIVAAADHVVTTFDQLAEIVLP